MSIDASIKTSIDAFGYYYKSIPSGNELPAVEKNNRYFKIASNVANLFSLPIIGTVVGLVRIILNAIGLRKVDNKISLHQKINKEELLESTKLRHDRVLLITEICRGVLETVTLGFAGIVLVPTDIVVSVLRHHDIV